MYPVFKKLFNSDDKGWEFLKNLGFSSPRISNLKKRGLSSFAKDLLLIEANKQHIQVQPTDFYKQ